MNFERHIFISDVHLGAFSEDSNNSVEHDLIALISHCKKERIKINILGDLFDYWMEYPRKEFVPKFGEKVLNAFEEYNNSVTPALFITGNHDNWTFGHFKQRGFDTESNFRIKTIGNKRFFLMHGDGIDDTKINFPRAVFHKLLRNQTFVNAYQKILPPKQGVAIMKIFSSITRKNNHPNPGSLNRQAKKIFESLDLDYIICGHDHIPRVETFLTGSYINLGAFFKQRTVALYNNKGLNLVTWKAASKNFIPFERNK